jgi:hypothetical protein
MQEFVIAEPAGGFGVGGRGEDAVSKRGLMTRCSGPPIVTIDKKRARGEEEDDEDLRPGFAIIHDSDEHDHHGHVEGRRFGGTY